MVMVKVEAASRRAHARRMVARKECEELSELLPRSASYACMRSFGRMLLEYTRCGGRAEHLEYAMRLQCEHSAVPLFAGSMQPPMHPRQLTATYRARTISLQVWAVWLTLADNRKCILPNGRLGKGMFAYLKEACLGLRSFGEDFCSYQSDGPGEVDGIPPSSVNSYLLPVTRARHTVTLGIYLVAPLLL